MGVYYSHCLIPTDNTIRPSPEQIAALIAAWMDQRYIVVGPRTDLSASRWSAPLALTGARFWTDPSLKEMEREPEPVPTPPKSLWSRLFGGPRGEPERRPPLDHGLPFVIPPEGVSWRALGQPDVVISWAANPDGLYPMETVAHEPFDSHAISIELSDDFANPCTDPYGIADDTLQLEGRCGCGCDLSYQGSGDRLSSERIRRTCPVCGEAFRPQDHPAEIVDDMTGAKIAQPGGLCRRFAIRIDFGRDHPVLRRNTDGALVLAKPKAAEHFLNTCETVLGFPLREFEDWG
jgi:hypothetical protein